MKQRRRIVPRFGLRSILVFTSLAILDLSDTVVTGKHLAELHSLRILLLGDTPLAERHFIEICKLPKLSSLDVQDCRNITETGLEGLVGSSTLEDLDLSNCRGISEAGLVFISRIPSLRTLKMARTGIASITNLSKLPHLNSISLSSNTVKIEDVLEFANRSEFKLRNTDPLADFFPMGVSYDGADSEYIEEPLIFTMAGQGEGEYWRTVTLEGLVGLGSQHLANYELSLFELSLARSTVKDDLFGALSTWAKLSDLNLEGCNVSNSDLKQIGALTNLKWLRLNSTAIDDEGLKHLSALTELTELTLNDTGVTQASLPVISGFTKLGRLELPFVPEAEELLQLLEACPNLNALSCNESKAKWRRFSSFDSDFYINSSIGIESVELGDEVFTPEQLERLLNVRRVYELSGRAIDDSHCEIIKNAESLGSLNFSGSHITDAGVAKLAERRRWKDLDFTNTQVTLQGIDQLRKNGTRVATLRVNSIENTGEVIGVIRELKGLSTLGYPVSKLPSADAKAIMSWCADHPLELYDTGNKSVLLNFELIPWMLGKSPYVTDAVTVHLSGALIDDAKIIEFTSSPNLQCVIVNNVACSSDRLIEKLLECKELSELYLYEVPLDIDAILRLKDLKRLRILELTRCGITDRHLPALNELSQLHELILNSNQITGGGLKDFTLPRQLDHFSLKVNPLTASARKTLQELTLQYPSLLIEK